MAWKLCVKQCTVGVWNSSGIYSYEDPSYCSSASSIFRFAYHNKSHRQWKQAKNCARCLCCILRKLPGERWQGCGKTCVLLLFCCVGREHSTLSTWSDLILEHWSVNVKINVTLELAPAILVWIILVVLGVLTCTTCTVFRIHTTAV